MIIKVIVLSKRAIILINKFMPIKLYSNGIAKIQFTKLSKKEAQIKILNFSIRFIGYPQSMVERYRFHQIFLNCGSCFLDRHLHSHCCLCPKFLSPHAFGTLTCLAIPYICNPPSGFVRMHQAGTGLRIWRTICLPSEDAPLCHLVWEHDDKYSHQLSIIYTWSTPHCVEPTFASCFK